MFVNPAAAVPHNSSSRQFAPLLPRRLLEHFRPVPRQELRLRQAFPALRLNQTGAVVGEQLRFRVAAAHQMAAEHDLVVFRQHRERAEVEDLVMEGTKREAVLHHVRPARLEPLDVRGFESAVGASLCPEGNPLVCFGFLEFLLT